MYNSGLENLVGKTKLEDGKVKAYNVKTKEIEEIRLGLYKSLKLKYKGFVKADERIYSGWSKKTPFYVYSSNVKDEKVFLMDYLHGKGRLDCML